MLDRVRLVLLLRFWNDVWPPSFDVDELDHAKHRTRHAGDGLSSGWRHAFAALNGARRWICLPLLLSAVSSSVLW